MPIKSGRHFSVIKVYLFFMCISSYLFSQEERTLFISHNVGGGIQLLSSSSSSTPNYNNSSIKYNNPGYFLFYRFQLNLKNENRLCLTLNGISRGGNYTFNEWNRHGSGSSIEGNFNSFRSDLGVSYFLTFGAYHASAFGFGVYSGRLMSSSGNIINTLTTNSGTYANVVQNKISSSEILTQKYLGISIELQNQLKLATAKYLALGFRIQIETPEVYYSKIGIITTLFAGFNFYKK